MESPLGESSEEQPLSCSEAISPLALDEYENYNTASDEVNRLPTGGSDFSQTGRSNPSVENAASQDHNGRFWHNSHPSSKHKMKGSASEGKGLSLSERSDQMAGLRTSRSDSGPGHLQAESKRHSWGAARQHGVIHEEPSSTLENEGYPQGINRTLSLDSAMYRKIQRLSNLKDTNGFAERQSPLELCNGQASSHKTQDDVPKVYPHFYPYGENADFFHEGPGPHNGELRHSGDIDPRPTSKGRTSMQNKEDFMDISHNPEIHSDQTMYITHCQRGHSTSTRCSDCCGQPSCGCDGTSGCCAPGRPLRVFCDNLFQHGRCSCKQKSDESDLDEDIYIEDDPFRKRCLRAFLNFVYVMLAFIAVIVTYSMIQDLITAMNNPVRSIHYKKLRDYEAPGISMYPGGAKFLACGHYYNNVVTSKVRTSDLDLVNRNCTYTRLNYDDPHYIGVRRDVLVVRGPTSFEKREAIFLHFELEDETRDFFTVSYFVFPGWDKFNASTVPEQIDQLTEYHKYMPTFALSSGLRMWIKLIMSETYLMDDTKHTEFRVEKEEAKHTEFNVEYSVVKFWDRRPEKVRKKHLFFIFFEWKNNIVEQSYLIYTTTPWSIGAGLCGVFLTLHRGYQLAQTGYKRARKDKERRSIRKRTIRELKKAKSMERRDGSGSTVNRKLKQQLSS